jgi:oligogalacturonide lyase
MNFTDNQMKRNLKLWVVATLLCVTVAKAQQLPVLETGGKLMPDEWIDKDTGFKVFKLTRRPGTNASFYFHNNPFVGDEMVFAGSNDVSEGDDMHHNAARGIYQMYAVNLKTLVIRQLTNAPGGVRTEIVCPATKELFYQHGDSVFAVDTQSLKTRLIKVMPDGLKGGIVTVNADGSLLAGKLDSPEEREILRNYPAKGDFFRRIFNARLRRTLFTLNTHTGELDTIYSERAWLNHLQFSPTDKHLLMFCHEGPWEEVDRIWTIDMDKKGAPELIHKRTMYREIAGHEWFGADGREIWFDLQRPRGETFFVGKSNIYTGEEQRYALTRDEWSVHYTTSWDMKLIAGDGGSKTSVAHSPQGQWIYRFDFAGDSLKATRLVSMKNHDYKLEPNVHFSPDNRWIIFRANFEGRENVYAVDLYSKR